jgi:tRNA(fMet)-specific endonuclease VapC
MGGYLLDTNHISGALYPVSRLRERLSRAHHAGIRLGTCVPVLCELEIVLGLRSQDDSYRRQLLHLLKRVRLWPLDRPVAAIYGVIYRDLKSRGRVVSQVDVMLAALAQHMNLTLLTTDRDFAALPAIRTENWLS